MVTIAIFYYLYLAIILFFIIYSFFNIYHLIRFGFASFTNIIIIIAYLVVATALLIYSFSLLIPIDWNIPLVNLQTSLFTNTASNINF